MDQSFNLTKQQLRDQYQSLRTDFPVDLARVATSQIVRHVLALVPDSPVVIGGYYPVRSELNLQSAYEALVGKGHTLCLPAALHRNQPLTFRCWHIGAPMQKGKYGIMEPLESEQEMVPDIMIVPLLAFDRKGNRLGYGAGYYDCTLAKLRALRPDHKELFAVGVAYAIQEAGHIPAEAHDEKLDAVVTEKGVMRFI